VPACLYQVADMHAQHAYEYCAASLHAASARVGRGAAAQEGAARTLHGAQAEPRGGQAWRHGRAILRDVRLKGRGQVEQRAAAALRALPSAAQRRGCGEGATHLLATALSHCLETQASTVWRACLTFSQHESRGAS